MAATGLLSSMLGFNEAMVALIVFPHVFSFVGVLIFVSVSVFIEVTATLLNFSVFFSLYVYVCFFRFVFKNDIGTCSFYTCIFFYRIECFYF